MDQGSFLVLTRRVGEGIHIGNDVYLKVSDMPGRNTVKLAISAPKDVVILRDEVKKKLESKK